MRVITATIFGEAMVQKIDRAFPSSDIASALLNYCGGESESSAYAAVCSMHELYIAKEDPFRSKIEAASRIGKTRVQEILRTAPADAKDDKMQLLLHVLKQSKHWLDSRPYWRALLEEACDHEHDLKEFCNMAHDVLGITPHAVAVERANKKHDAVHSKARASLCPDRTVKALYIYSNLRLTDDDNARTKVAQLSDLGESTADLFGQHAWESETEDLPADDMEDADPRPALEDIDEDLASEPMEVPSGFKAMSEPDALLTGDAMAGVFIIMMFNVAARGQPERLAQFFGKMFKYCPRARKYPFEIMWDDGKVHKYFLTLRDYHVPDADSMTEPKKGSWCYLKKSRTARL